MLAYLSLVRDRSAPLALFSGKVLVAFAIGTLGALFYSNQNVDMSIVDYAELSVLTKWPRGIFFLDIACGALWASTR